MSIQKETVYTHTDVYQRRRQNKRVDVIQRCLHDKEGEEDRICCGILVLLIIFADVSYG